MTRIAVIPARGGSKRIPRKNIKEFCGQPMIAYSIQAAFASDCFDEVIVSTDDEQVADIATQYGAEVPFMRPADLADDNTGTIPVIKHAIEQYNKHGTVVDYVCCLYATAPFLKADDIAKGWQVISSNNHDYAISVTSYAFPVQRAVRVNEQGMIAMLNPEQFNSRSQDLESVWHDAGQFYWGRSESWLAEKSVFNGRTKAIKLPRYRVQDIDTLEDWHQAELIYKALQDSSEAG